LCYNDSFSAVNDTIPIVTIKANITAFNEAPLLRFPNIDSKYYFVTLTLTNTQDTSIRFTIMTCSWSSSFVTDIDSIIIRPQECDSNFPVTIEIKPGKSAHFFAELHSSKKNSKGSQPVNFKVGFVDLTYKELESFNRLSKSDIHKHKIYWSNSIPLLSKLNSYKFEN
jgi:hypothetical protein